MDEQPPEPALKPHKRPRWLKVSAIIIGAVVVLLVVLLLTGVLGGGRHGPGRHTPGGESAPSSPMHGR
jgi:hypothetical protein